MKKTLLFLTFSFLLLSCIWMDRFYFFIFENNSQKELYIIIDTNTQDDIISAGSWIDWVASNNHRSVQRKDMPWDEFVRDSAYIYVLDCDMIDLPIKPLSTEDQERITDDMILDRITLYNKDLHQKYTVRYPQ